MSLKSRLENNESKLSTLNGATPKVNDLATKQSKLHADAAGAAGYSLDGGFSPEVKNAYSKYEDGVVNFIPQPSELDLNGKQPKTYRDNAPEGRQF